MAQVDEGQRDESERVAYAPTAGDVEASAGVISVNVRDDEEVRWHWAHYPDGRSVVTGYDIIPKDEDAEPAVEGFSFKDAVADLLWPGEEKKGARRRQAGRQADAPRESPGRKRRAVVGFLSSAS